jgi:hypothetical protein
LRMVVGGSMTGSLRAFKSRTYVDTMGTLLL